MFILSSITPQKAGRILKRLYYLLKEICIWRIYLLPLSFLFLFSVGVVAQSNIVRTDIIWKGLDIKNTERARTIITACELNRVYLAKKWIGTYNMPAIDQFGQKIRKMPGSIVNMPSESYVGFQGCNIQELPKSLLNYQGEKKIQISLNGNPVEITEAERRGTNLLISNWPFQIELSLSCSFELAHQFYDKY